MLSLLKAYLFANKRAFLDCCNQLKSAPLASSVLIAVIGIALSLPIGMWVFSMNAKRLTNQWHHSAQLSVFIGQGLSEAEVKQQLLDIRQLPNVAFANYISPAQGLQQLQEQTGMSDVVTLLDDNPLPAVIEVHPDHASAAEIKKMTQQLEAQKGVSQVKVDLQWLTRLDSILLLADKAASGLMVILAMAVLLVVGNAIRLTITQRRQEVELLKLLGATKAYIRRPFLYFGVMHGVLGAIFAWLLVMVLTAFLQGGVSTIAKLYYTHFALQGLSIIEVLGLMLLGGSLGFIGGYMSLVKHLHEG